MNAPPESELERTQRMIHEIEDIPRRDRTQDEQSQLTAYLQKEARLTGGNIFKIDSANNYMRF